MSSVPYSKLSGKEKSLINRLTKQRSIIKCKDMNRFVFRKKKEAWSEITEAFNAEGIGKTRTANELKRLWGNQNKK